MATASGMVVGGLVILLEPVPLQMPLSRSLPKRFLKEEEKEVVAPVVLPKEEEEKEEEKGEDGKEEEVLPTTLHVVLLVGTLSIIVRPRPHRRNRLSGSRSWSIFKPDFEGTELTGPRTGMADTEVTTTGGLRS